MTLRQLRHLVALADKRSFSLAAQALCLTQPALSRSIAALETELGLPLFDRIGRRLELTPFGRQTLEQAHKLLDDADHLRASGQMQKDGIAGTLRVGMGSGAGALLAAPLLLTMATAHPAVRVEVARGSTELLLHALRLRDLDALVVDARSVTQAPDLQLQLVHELPGAFMVRQGHPLARRRAIRFDELLRLPIAATPLSDEVAQMLVEHYGPAAHPAACVTLQCDELSSLLEVVRNSDAVLVAVRAAAPDLVSLKLKPALSGTARFGLVTLARRTALPALGIVRELIRKTFGEEPCIGTSVAAAALRPVRPRSRVVTNRSDK